MDYSVYIAKTMVVAFTKIGPVVGFIIMGYFVFIKLPFLFFRRSLKATRSFEGTPFHASEGFKQDFNFKDYDNFLKRQARIESGQPKEEQKKEERRKEERKAPPKHEKSRSGVSREEQIFNLEAGERLSKQELKKRYRDLLKQNHPDKVASEGTQLRLRAEIKSKEINSAYEKLKSRAA